MKRRIGSFSLSKHLVDEAVDSGEMSVLNRVFKDVVIVSTSYYYPTDCFVYYALSPLFEEVPEALEPIPYTCVMTNDTIEWRKS